MHVDPKFGDEKLNFDTQPVPGCLPGAARKDARAEPRQARKGRACMYVLRMCMHADIYEICPLAVCRGGEVEVRSLERLTRYRHACLCVRMYVCMHVAVVASFGQTATIGYPSA